MNVTNSLLCILINEFKISVNVLNQEDSNLMGPFDDINEPMADLLNCAFKEEINRGIINGSFLDMSKT